LVLYRIRGDGLSDIKEDLAFPNFSSRGVDGIDPEDCVSTVNSRGRIRIILREIGREIE